MARDEENNGIEKSIIEQHHLAEWDPRNAEKKAEKKIEEALKSDLIQLYLYSMGLIEVPASIGQLTQLVSLDLSSNDLTTLPESLGHLVRLEQLKLQRNKIHALNGWVSKFTNLTTLGLSDNQLTDLPSSLVQLEHLKELNLDNNPLNPELAEAYKQGIDGVKSYLRAKVEGGEVVLNEAKLILVGEGGVGKTSLLAALRGEPWVENRETTHGVEVAIKSLVVKDPMSGKQITLNGWDFGGQNIYRHTHQLFFTAPAVYLAVWDPRRGPEQCCVNEWIKMIKHRAFDETRHSERPRILVVATKGGPKERLDHIDEQALRDEFGDLICGFYHIDSKPNDNGVCYQLDELKQAIAREAASIPSVGRSVPLSWKNVLEAIRRRGQNDPYITYERFEALCSRQKVSNELAALYATILNELGHLIYYRGDDTLKDTVILRPDYLSKAISFVLEDKASKDNHGLVEHHHLSEIWFDPARPENERYPKDLHPIFVRLMEKFDLSYQVAMPELSAPPTSLVTQLVPNLRPDDWAQVWEGLRSGDVERAQVCRILDAETGRTVEVDGLIYRLIVRLHRYSLGRKNYYNSRHWKTGLLLDDGYNGRAFIEEIGGDVHVTVRAAYPERFLHQLCTEAQWLVKNFWKGLDAKLFVPCPTEKCKGLLEIDEMMDNRSNGLDKIRCSVCRKYHEIDSLMATMQPKPVWDEAVATLRNEHRQILQAQDIGFDRLSTQLRVLMSQADEQYENMLAWLSNPARDGPRLFSIEPVQLGHFDPANWTHETFSITLWCEHARVPLPVLNGKDSKKGIYEINLTREWFKKAAPVLKVITTTASLVLPVASAGLKIVLDETIYKKLDFSKEVINASLSGFSKSTDLLTQSDMPKELRADDSSLRELHAFLQKEDPTFGGLKRVQNKRREFLWVHERFASEY
ncbi:MAG: leucine-rich repeat domain-containing protein [Anaerolineales bacterium]|nr:leucine-rich repeat domain-containing protein [Anaerolineales bacterium]